jgi:Sulfatase
MRGGSSRSAPALLNWLSTGRRWEWRWRQEGSRLLELAALCGFAVAQPTYEAVAAASEFLVFGQAGRGQIIFFTLALAIVPPVLLWSVEWVAGLVIPRLRHVLHVAFVAVLAYLFGVVVAKSATGLRGLPVSIVALTGAGCLTAVYLRWRPTRSWLRIASPAPLVFAALFLLASPVSALVRADPPSELPSETTGDAAPVVMVVFDEFPLLTILDESGGIDERLFPNFAGLAREATFFRNTTSVAARTPHALPAMLSGQHPSRSLAPISSRYPGNLFALLGRTHDVRAFESITGLCPSDVCPTNSWGRSQHRRALADWLRVWTKAVSPTVGDEDPVAAWLHEDTVPSEAVAGSQDNAWFLLDRVNENQPVRFRQFLDSIDGQGTPFHFVHLILPHQPWRYLPDGLQYPPRSIGLVNYDERTAEAWPAVVNRQRHLLQAMYVDRLLGQVVDRLKQVGLYQRSALVVTADHGISFMPGLKQGTRTLHPDNAHEVAWVPLLVKAPGQAHGETRDDNVMSVDLAPTVAQLAGMSVPWQLDGMSLLGDRRADADKVWFNTPGRPIHLDGESGYRRILRREVQQRVGRPHEGVEGLFKLGAFADLVGTALDRWHLSEPNRLTAKVDGIAAFADVDPSGGTVPSLVSGHLRGRSPSSGSGHVAIALNGTIAAVSELYTEGGQQQSFAAMVSPARMRSGANTVEVFVLEGEPGRPTLHPARVG